MPMALAASLGTTLTLFSAPAFLLARDLLERSDAGSLGICSRSRRSARCSWCSAWPTCSRCAGCCRDARARTHEGEYLRLDATTPNWWSTRNRRGSDVRWPTSNCKFVERLQVVDWMRDGARRARDSARACLLAGDVLLVRASPDEIASIRDEPGLDLHAVAKYGDDTQRASRGADKSASNGRARLSKPARSSWCRPWSRRTRSSPAARLATSISCARSAWWSWGCGARKAGSTRKWRGCRCRRATCWCCGGASEPSPNSPRIAAS